MKYCLVSHHSKPSAALVCSSSCSQERSVSSPFLSPSNHPRLPIEHKAVVAVRRGRDRNSCCLCWDLKPWQPEDERPRKGANHACPLRLIAHSSDSCWSTPELHVRRTSTDRGFAPTTTSPAVVVVRCCPTACDVLRSWRARLLQPPRSHRIIPYGRKFGPPIREGSKKV